MGFNRDQVLTFHLPSVESRNHVAAMKQQLLQNRLIQGVSAASNPIGGNDIGTNGFYFEVDVKMPSASMMAQNFFVDEDFVKTMELKVLQGRNFSVQGEGDRYNGVLINETLVKKLNWKDPLGKRVEFNIDNKGTKVSRVVVGVVNDFHIYSMQHKIAPLAFTAAQRKKEIGVRKVLGASVWGIVRLLSLDFLKLLVAAVLVAVPLAWWYMDKWLMQFAYHIDAGPGVFVLTAAMVTIIALLTVSYHAIRSALANPAQSLRSPD